MAAILKCKMKKKFKLVNFKVGVVVNCIQLYITIWCGHIFDGFNTSQLSRFSTIHTDIKYSKCHLTLVGQKDGVFVEALDSKV